MDELIKTVMEKAGISEGQAGSAVEVVLAQLRDKLPGPIADQVESALGGSGGGSGGGAADALKGLGGMLGR